LILETIPPNNPLERTPPQLAVPYEARP